MTTKPTDGFLLCDKPSGVTSFTIVAEARRRYRVRQVGHAGTLDPLASGLLPILVGEATKLTPWTMGMDKVYLATLRFGAATDTYDADGRVTQQADPGVVSEERLRAALPAFTGHIMQKPPAFSAIKKDGQPLYKLARATAREGGDVDAIEVGEREVTVHGIELVELLSPSATLRIHCGKGTYIRSIAHDLGIALGAFAHLTALRRLRIGHFDVAHAVDLRAARETPALLPLERAVDHLPSVTIDDAAERRVRLGQQSVLEGLAPPDHAGALRLCDAAGRLIAIAEPALKDPGEENSGPRLQLARVFRAPP